MRGAQFMTIRYSQLCAHLYKLLAVQQHLQDAEGAEPAAGMQLYGFQLILGFEG